MAEYRKKARYSKARMSDTDLKRIRRRERENGLTDDLSPLIDSTVGSFNPTELKTTVRARKLG